MSEPYLILHKVRGEPAFDIAERLLECTEANEAKGVVSLDVIWIIPTSGHRAYPMWQWPLETLDVVYEGGTINAVKDALCQWKPDQFPDHYACNEAPKPKPPARAVATTDDFLI
jgi:hypothetical protein